MKKFNEIFRKTRTVLIGMIHVDPLPGSPKYRGSIGQIIEKACREAEVYAESQIDGVVIENMHDVPYMRSKDISFETITSMTRISSEVKRILGDKMPIGIQVLAGGNQQAMAIAHSCDLDFVRVEGFVFSHIGDEGFIDACAGPLTRYRAALNAHNIHIWTDIKKKHSSHSITDDLSIEDVAKAAEFFLSDAVIVTGASTGRPADFRQVECVKKAIGIPVVVGSGVTLENIDKFLMADALIVGSYFKKNGRWEEELDMNRVKKMMEKINKSL